VVSVAGKTVGAEEAMHGRLTVAVACGPAVRLEVVSRYYFRYPLCLNEERCDTNRGASENEIWICLSFLSDETSS